MFKEKFHDPEYERFLEKHEFFKRVSEKYTGHTKLLTHWKNFNQMIKEVNRISDLYGEMIRDYNKPDFDYIGFEEKFDNLIKEDLRKLNKA